MSIFSEPRLLSPTLWNNLRIGLLGGSFDPVHEGHTHISELAIKTLSLDYVWWLITPQNPNKSRAASAIKERMGACKDFVENPKIIITTLEEQTGTRKTYQTIQTLKKRFSKTKFIWLAGMDNALSFHQWDQWQTLMNEIPMAYMARHPVSSLIQNAPIKMCSFQNNRHLNKGGLYSMDSGQTYWLSQKKIIRSSSTEIREKSIKTVI